MNLLYRICSLAATLESVCCLLGRGKSNGDERAGPYLVAGQSPGHSRGGAVGRLENLLVSQNPHQHQRLLHLKEMKDRRARRQRSAHGNVMSDLSDRGANLVRWARALTENASPRRGNPVAADGGVAVAAAAASAAAVAVGRMCQKCAGAWKCSGLSETFALLLGARRPYFAVNLGGDSPGSDHFEQLVAADVAAVAAHRVQREMRIAAGDPTRTGCGILCFCHSCSCL